MTDSWYYFILSGIGMAVIIVESAADHINKKDVKWYKKATVWIILGLTIIGVIVTYFREQHAENVQREKEALAKETKKKDEENLLREIHSLKVDTSRLYAKVDSLMGHDRTVYRESVNKTSISSCANNQFKIEQKSNDSLSITVPFCNVGKNPAFNVKVYAYLITFINDSVNWYQPIGRNVNEQTMPVGQTILAVQNIFVFSTKIPVGTKFIIYTKSSWSNPEIGEKLPNRRFFKIKPDLMSITIYNEEEPVFNRLTSYLKKHKIW